MVTYVKGDFPIKKYYPCKDFGRPDNANKYCRLCRKNYPLMWKACWNKSRGSE